MVDSVLDISVICACSHAGQRKKASDLASRLNLPLQKSIDERFRFHLVYTEYRLELQHNPLLHDHKEHPVSVDFLQDGKIHHRIATSSVKSPLARAAGLKAGRRPLIADATAGLGMDSIVLAWLGCSVLLIERNAIIHALLQDGLERAANNRLLHSVIGENMRLIHGDSVEILALNGHSADAVLVDPMYPQKRKGGLNKKEMRLLRAIAGDDTDDTELFRAALRHAGSRVVVKRPKGAPIICPAPTPAHSIPMKSGRFDVYLTRQQPPHL